MNSIKNAIVTITLLTVAYGAYVVLNNPADDDMAHMADSPVGPPNSAGVMDSTELISQGGLPELPVVEMEPSIGNDRSRTMYSDQTIQVERESVDPSERASRMAPPANFGPTTQFAPTDRMVSPDNALTPSTFSEPPQAASLVETPAATSPLVAEPPTEPSRAQRLTGVSSTELPPAVATPVAPNPQFEQDWQLAREEADQGRPARALAVISSWHGVSSLNAEQSERCLDLLDQLAGIVIYSREHLLEPNHQVAAGETLDEIAKRYDVPPEMIAKINGIEPPYALMTGEQLKVVRGPFRAEVRLSDSSLTLFVGSYYAGKFPIQVGRDLPNQEATYHVAEKLNGRNYFDRKSGREIERGEPVNRYGNHWLGLRGDQITAGHAVGIHGRPDDGSSIVDSEGSISLAPNHAEDIYAILSIGSKVQVRY